MGRNIRELNANEFIEKLEKKRAIKKIRKKKNILCFCFFIAIMSVSTINTNALLNDIELKETPADKTEEIVKKEDTEDSSTMTIVEVTSKNAEQIVPQDKKQNEIYNENIPIPKEHQEYLYKLCEERGLDYKNMLSVIKNESQFDVNCISNHDYGYFQINKVNHENLSKELETQCDALDPYINMNWGTYMLSNLYKKWENKGYNGEELNNMVLSEYNQGTYGLQKWGLANEYIRRVNNEKKIIDSIF